MVLGKKQMEQLAAFTATALCFGMSAGFGLVYITDWKAVATFIPYYNDKFPPALRWGGCGDKK